MKLRTLPSSSFSISLSLSQTQAEALLSAEWDSLRPDAVILIDRPDELIKEFSLGYVERLR